MIISEETIQYSREKEKKDKNTKTVSKKTIIQRRNIAKFTGILMGLIGLVAIALPYIHYSITIDGVEGSGSMVLSLYSLFQSTTSGALLGLTAFLFIASILSFITPYGSLLGTVGFILCPLILCRLGDISYSIQTLQGLDMNIVCSGTLYSMAGYIVIGILFVIPFIFMSLAEEYKEKKGEWRKMDGLLYLFKPSDKF